MIKILLSGCNGKMGQVITRLVSERDDVTIVAGFDQNDSIKNTYSVYKDLSKCTEEVDVVIDFSHPLALDAILDFSKKRKAPIVVATTGLSQTQEKSLESAAKTIPVFKSANMSLGVNLLIKLVKAASIVLEDCFDIEIIEKHHNQKIDSPSGTALAIADAINSVLASKQEYIYDRHSRRKKRSRTEIGIHAVRGGTIVGEHSVIFAGTDEIIEINHQAASKEIFAVGAIKAAIYLYDKKPGYYSMNDVVELDIK